MTARRARSSGRFALSRKPTKRSTTSIKPDTEAQANAWLCAICCATTSSSIGRNPIRAGRLAGPSPTEGLREMCTYLGAVLPLGPRAGTA